MGFQLTPMGCTLNELTPIETAKNWRLVMSHRLIQLAGSFHNSPGKLGDKYMSGCERRSLRGAIGSRQAQGLNHARATSARRERRLPPLPRVVSASRW